jgi:hypothetical protein
VNEKEAAKKHTVARPAVSPTTRYLELGEKDMHSTLNVSFEEYGILCSINAL